MLAYETATKNTQFSKPRLSRSRIQLANGLGSNYFTLLNLTFSEHIYDFRFLGLQVSGSKISVSTVFPKECIHDVFLFFINALYLNKHQV